MNPRDNEAFLGTTTVFECHYSYVDAINVHTTWIVNRTTFNKLTSPTICGISVNTESPSDNMIISTLSITAALECNKTEVQCITLLLNGSSTADVRVQHIDLSQEALLYVRGKKSTP